MSDPATNADGANESLFDVADDTSPDDGAPDRVQSLKRVLFDLAYLLMNADLMNADGTEHVSEQMLIQKLERRLKKEGSVNVEGRADDLRPLLDEGPAAIRDRVQTLADEFVEEAGDRAQPLAHRVLDLLKGMVVADASVSPEEGVLFNDLCERWNVDMELPQ